jgi:hypothetical protein
LAAELLWVPIVNGRIVRNAGRLVVCLLGLGCARTAFAQQPAPPADPETPPTTLLERVKEPPDQGGGFHVTKHFAVVFGGIKQGSGIAVGPAVSQTFADGGYAQVKAVYSVRNFKLLQARYDSRKLWRGRATVASRLRWQDAPDLSLFALGPDVPELSVEYGERKIEGSARISLQLAPMLRIASGVGIERYATSGGRIDLLEDERLASVPRMPGLGTHPWFSHTFLSAALDSRNSPDYSVSGRLIEAAIHDYRDWHDGQDSFERVEGTAQQLLPTCGGRGVADLSAQIWLSYSSGRRSVPFFLMPTLGGSNYLNAYRPYRFRDRNALVLKGEYRWAVHPMVDVAGVYEVGKVGPTLGSLSLDHMAESIGAGLRVHAKTSSLVNLDIAHGRDGFGFAIGFSTGGS